MRRIRRRIVIWMNYQGLLRIVTGVMTVVFIVFLLTQDLPVSRTWTYWTLPLSGKVIVVDAGHGGVDPGALSRDGVIEKDLNLAITLYLRDYLQQAGALVIMTREDDRDLADKATKGYSKRKTEDLFRRAELVTGKNPDLFISIHMNSVPSPKWSGAQTFYYPNHPDNARLAELIQEEIRQNLENTGRMAKPVNTIYLLKTIDQLPSVLVEVGFLSHPDESLRLADATYQKQVAASIYRAVLRFSAGEEVGVIDTIF
jgi:N-acetylmuramoyl-L-alanine amidase